jgi:hypothetical protein
MSSVDLRMTTENCSVFGHRKNSKEFGACRQELAQRSGWATCDVGQREGTISRMRSGRGHGGEAALSQPDRSGARSRSPDVVSC